MTSRLLIGAVTAVLLLSGCQSDTAPSPAEGAAARTTDEPIFTEDIEDAKCALLTLKDVTAATGLPPTAIEEEYAGCFYSWGASSDRPGGSLFLYSLRVHDTAERAQRHYARKTEDVTASQISEGKEQVKSELAEQRAEGEITSSEEETASALTDAMPEMDFKHRALSGIGYEAAMNNRGSVYLRLGNVTIEVVGKTDVDDRDRIDPALAEEVSRRIAANLRAR